jgi:RNA-binding protein YhbY
MVGKSGVTEAVLNQIRALFGSTDLLKIRLPSGEGEEADRSAELIAQGVPCELVARRGFTVVYFRASDGGGGD